MDASRTEFASADRQNRDSLQFIYYQLKDLPHVKALCESLPHVVMFLNKDRQIVFSNQKLVELAGLSSVDECLGMRPGELFNCIHAQTGPSGCGTAGVCQVCGAVLAVLESQQHKVKATRELRLSVHVNDDVVAFDFQVSAAPFELNGQALTVVSLIDISDQKRRRTLERIFFHDILNTAGGLLNLAGLLCDTCGPDEQRHAHLIHLASRQLIEEISAQRELMKAESGELKVKLTAVDSLDCIKQTMGLFEDYQQIHQVQIQQAVDSEAVVHDSDRSLLLRVLGNLSKNALEACSAGTGQIVTIGCRREDSHVQYWVHNPSAMSKEVQMQIFQRSFSTKGAGRGLGTYSVRLLTEKFLSGKVTFKSSESAGTCFTVSCPLQPH